MSAYMKIVLSLHRNSEMKISVEIAEVAQLVEHDLAKVGVASSSLVFRSKKGLFLRPFFHQGAQVVKLVDTRDLKSLAYCRRVGSSPTPGTNEGYLGSLLFF